jgi:hypothetical protein
MMSILILSSVLIAIIVIIILLIIIVFIIIISIFIPLFLIFIAVLELSVEELSISAAAAPSSTDFIPLLFLLLLNRLYLIILIEVKAAQQVFQVSLPLLVREHGLEAVQVSQEVSMVYHHLVEGL